MNKLELKDAWRLQYMLVAVFAPIQLVLIMKGWTGGAFLWGLLGGIAFVGASILLWATHLEYLEM